MLFSHFHFSLFLRLTDSNSFVKSHQDTISSQNVNANMWGKYYYFIATCILYPIMMSMLLFDIDLYIEHYYCGDNEFSFTLLESILENINIITNNRIQQTILLVIVLNNKSSRRLYNP